jgi:hypothetical protein
MVQDRWAASRREILVFLRSGTVYRAPYKAIAATRDRACRTQVSEWHGNRRFDGTEVPP